MTGTVQVTPFWRLDRAPLNRVLKSYFRSSTNVGAQSTPSQDIAGNSGCLLKLFST